MKGTVAKGAVAWVTAVLVLVAGPWAAPPAAAEVFFDLYTGKNFTHDADIRVRQPSLGNDFRVADVPFDAESFQSPIYYGLRAGYFFDRLPWLGAALEFFHFKIFAETTATRRLTGTRGGVAVDAVQPVDAVVQEFSISHGVNYLTLDALVRRSFLLDRERFPHGRLQVYGGLGVGPVIAHPENRIDGVNNVQRYELGGVGAQALAGVRALLFRHAGLFVEYKFTFSDLEVTVAAGDARLSERSHHVVGGITIPFR